MRSPEPLDPGSIAQARSITSVGLAPCVEEGQGYSGILSEASQGVAVELIDGTRPADPHRHAAAKLRPTNRR